MEHVNGFKAAVSAALAVMTALWGWFGWLVVAWVFSMGLDYMTGSLAAIKRKDWDSGVAREGLYHKGGSIVVVMEAGLLDLVVGLILGNVLPADSLPFEYTVLLCPLALAWYILTEAGSIIENAAALGAPYPYWMRKAVEMFKDKVDKVGNGVAESDQDTSQEPYDSKEGDGPGL